MAFNEGKRYDRQAKILQRNFFPDRREAGTFMVPGGFYFAFFQHQNKHLLDVDEDGNVAITSVVDFLKAVKGIDGNVALDWNKGMEAAAATSAGHRFTQGLFIPGAPAQEGQATLDDALRAIEEIEQALPDPQEPPQPALPAEEPAEEPA